MSRFRLRCWLILSLSIPACGPGKVVDTTKPSVGTVARPGADATVGASSDDVLTSAIYQLRPENFGINSATDKPVSLLNSWRFKQAEAGITPDESVPVSAPSGWIQPDEQTRLETNKFDTTDAVHVRDALFHRAIAGYLSDRGRDELQRVSVIVDFVCRNVALWKDDEIELPLLPYLTMQLGRGTAEDRAWVIAEILKQLRIDALILSPKSSSAKASENWLLGVPVEGQIYLFDIRLGLPVASGATDARTSIAALAEIVSHPEWLELMSANEPYRLKGQDLSNVDVFVITDPNSWCRRMFNLEQVLPTSDVCVLYESLLNPDEKSGLLQRTSKAGDWQIDDLKLWSYPRTQMEEMTRRSPERDQELQRLTIPFNVPIPFKEDAQGKLQVGTPERKLQKYRTEHLLGKFTEATTHYLRIRHLDVEPSPPDIERINRLASEDALYWTTLCKYELGEYATAVDLLSDYLRKYDRKGKWFFPARSLLAQSYAHLDRIPEAITTLERTSSDDPYRMANALRVKRWSAVPAN